MMKKAVAVILIILAIYWSFSAIIPSKISSMDAPNAQFSTQRALVHLKEISKTPHFLGSEAHQEVQNYIVTALEHLGIETQLQTDYAIGEWGNFSKPTNILGRIKGSEKGKALLLLTHYDSHPHSSFGASDAGSGVVTILEGLRAFLSTNKTPKNDIIILITDGEELGLNGADIFVNKHPWAKDVGLAVNFEARGSGGPSIMLVETNKGNANLIKGFVNANPEFPLGNSLFYSIYKLLPNDTDLTRFREDADIDGFNFAFVDDHFDYHTALDTYDRLDRNTLEHQGSYLMAMLNYFSAANLDELKSIDDLVYFNVPFLKMVTYPYSWILPLFILAVLVFALLLFYGLNKRKIEMKPVGKGFAAFFGALMACVVLGVFGWKLLLLLYPQYSEMLHGFTYNGHTYISAFVCITLALCLLVYSKVYKPENAASLMVAPLFFWLVISGIIAFKLKGASFFIIPVYFGLLSFFILLKRKKPRLVLLTLLGFPMLFVFSPMVQMFPVGLGLKMLVTSTAFVVLMFGLLISVFAFFRHKKRWGYLFLLFGLYYLVSAHFKSDFNRERPKPNSLMYVLDADTNSAKWMTYDTVLDDWTAHFFNKTSKDTIGIVFSSKYNTKIQFAKTTEVKPIPQPVIEIANDTVVGAFKTVDICVTPLRDVQRMEFFADTSYMFYRIKINGMDVKPDKDGTVFNKRKSNRLLRYYVSKNEPLELQITVPKEQSTEFLLYEASYNLMDHELFDIPDRYPRMIPKPFVLNDAVVIKERIVVP
ncbi:M28 family peptidase [Hyunsoonleella flava]|uniref:Vacuolar membrane protease n=1 Tax=Hyunsoonleella flava TaxID=2527939 RepID=A0A4Q9FCS7_9FLAO|nr:M28 family peptidase [Hyunsoonleella flava]TBN01890.1 M28 family peptidase [Hyunsoonleella flava]